MTREEALFKAKDVLDEATEYEDAVCYVTGDDREWLDMAIKALEQEPKTGHWIYDRRRDWDGECKYECSECGMGSDVDYAYCMRCGAKMESEE